MPRLKRDPKALFLQLNDLYFDGLLDPETEVRFVDFPGTGAAIDTRCDSAAIHFRTGDPALIELHSNLHGLGADYMALALAHEMVHLKYPVKAQHHGAKVWGEEYRRLVGLGFFQSIF